jgi:hypothetical protein
MNVTSCDNADYAIPAVGGLPDDALGVAAAIKTRSVEGATPSLAALSGVLASGVAYAATHPRDNTVAVFATDGLPTICIPNYFETPLTEVVLDVAEAAAAGADAGIVTFVIGVFAPEEQDLAQTNLDTIAKAGGTDVAYVITTEESVTDRFLEALLAVRDAQRCDYAIPELDEPPSDWTKVSVSMTIDGSQVSGTRRDGPAQCTDQPGDFYYDVALGDDSAPAQITLCPATCDLAPDQLEASCR